MAIANALQLEAAWAINASPFPALITTPCQV